MTQNEKAILMAWSQGLAGSNPRLAKRAWWVLEDGARRPPGEMVGAWANASEAQRWILNFHTMGVIGLMDAPRKGRPSMHQEKIIRAHQRIRDLRSQGNDTDAHVLQVLQSLDQHEKEALWRIYRTVGASLLRRRGGMDLPIPVPPGLSDLMCVHLGSGVKILSYLPMSNRHFNELNGLWLGVPPVTLSHRREASLRNDLLHALSLEVHKVTSPGKFSSTPQKLIKHEGALEQRILNHLECLATERPNTLVVHLLVDFQQGPTLIRVMNGLRSRRLWNHGLRKPTGLLAELRVFPYEGSWAQVTQSSLVSCLSHASGVLLGELQDKLTLKRKGVFTWIRVPDTD